MTIEIAVSHNFETAHRLPCLPGKCQNVHGHSWLAKITVHGEMDKNGIICDYGRVKKIVREWIDTHLDHGAMLGSEDNLLSHFISGGSKVFLFGETDVPSWREGASGTYPARPWPTVEAVAEMLAVKLQERLSDTNCMVVKVEVRETAVNFATWRAK